MSQADPTNPADDPYAIDRSGGDTAIGGSSGGGGVEGSIEGSVDASSLTESAGESTSAGGSSSAAAASAGRPAEATDSRRVAPKWLGKRIGRFRLQGLLGAGAVGRVFRAEDAILHRRVALKVISSHSADGQINRDIDQFLTEARAAAALEHPHVVQIYEAGESGTLCYIAMELLEGGSLKDLVEAAGPMDPGRACTLAADAAEALAAGHAVGIVHRDVKPANLMLTRTGRCKVTDFGLATIADADGAVAGEKSAGTPLFAAPEVIRGNSADERSDIYSLGATLYYLLAGRPPYKAKTRREVLRMHVEEPIPNLRAVRPGLPEPLVAAVERALDKDPGQRFMTAMQFARVLRVMTIPTGPAASPAGPPTAGESLMNLSGMTPVAGSSSSRLRSLTPGPLAAADLPAGPPPSPPTVDYRTPPTPVRRWVPIAAVCGGLAAVVLVTVMAMSWYYAASASNARRVATAAPSPPKAPAVVSPPSPVVPPIAPPIAPPEAVATVPLKPMGAVPASAATPAPADASPGVDTAAAIDVSDLPQLTQLAAARPSRTATVVGTVTQAQLGGSGKVVRIEFADSKFVVVYFDTNGTLFRRMADRFGPAAARLAGRTVRVTGRVRLYDGIPEIILTRPTDLHVQPQ